MRVVVITTADPLADISACQLTKPGAHHEIVGLVRVKAPLSQVVSLALAAMRNRSAYYFTYMIAEALLPGRFAALRPDVRLLDFAAHHKLPLLDAIDINAPAVLRFCARHDAEVLLSLRPGQIFRKRFISEAPPILNLHCTRLPDYRGMGGILHAMAAGEPHHGISVHGIVSEAVDDGPLYAQISVPAIIDASLYHQTLALYAQSGAAIQGALDALKREEVMPKSGEGSLNSWPGPAPRKTLHARGQSLISLREFFRAPLSIPTD